MGRMELAQLRTLVHVAELGSLSKAADRLRVAQPALSRQVRLLEQELGAALFTRHGRGMVLTETGRRVLDHARRVMAELEALRTAASEQDGSLRGRIAIGLPPTVADIISEPLVAAFGRSHPHAELRLVGAYTGYLLDGLHQGELDVGVLYDPHTARSLRSRPLLLEKLFLIGPPSDAKPTGRPVRFAALRDKRLLLPSQRHGLRIILEKCAAEAGIALDVAVETDSYATLKDLVRNGHGWTVLPLAPIHDDLREGRLVAQPLVAPAPVRRLVLSFPADRAPSRLALFAGETIAWTIADLVARGVWPGEMLGA